MLCIITVHSVCEGRVSGSWVQNCVGGLEAAIERCEATSRINSDIPMAVVPEMSNQGIGGYAFEAELLYLTKAHEASQ